MSDFDDAFRSANTPAPPPAPPAPKPLRRKRKLLLGCGGLFVGMFVLHFLLYLAVPGYREDLDRKGAARKASQQSSEITTSQSTPNLQKETPTAIMDPASQRAAVDSFAAQVEEQIQACADTVDTVAKKIQQTIKLPFNQRGDVVTLIGKGTMVCERAKSEIRSFDPPDGLPGEVKTRLAAAAENAALSAYERANYYTFAHSYNATRQGKEAAEAALRLEKANGLVKSWRSQLEAVKTGI